MKKYLLIVLFTANLFSQSNQRGEILSETPLYPLPENMTFEEYQDMNRRMSIWVGLAFIPIPVSTDLYSATGDYEEIVGYKVVIENTSSTASLIGPNDLFLFQNAPNPTKGNNVNINFYSPKSDNFNLSIVNLLGKVVYSQTVNSTIGINEIKINNILPDGVYHYSISNKEKTLTKRMIVSR